MSFALKLYCNDGNCAPYWDTDIIEYRTYDEAMIACYRSALKEASCLMEDSDIFNWFEVRISFNVEEAKTVFPVAVVHYNKAPWDRENDCDITVVTGYSIVQTNPIAEASNTLSTKHNTLKAKRMVYEKDGQRIVFDDWVNNTEEYNTYWVGMCPHCLSKHKSILGNRVDDCGSGCCSVEGCNNEADFYVDFDMNEVHFIE